MAITFFIGQGQITCFDSFFQKWYQGPEGNNVSLVQAHAYFRETIDQLQTSDIQTDWEREMGQVSYAMNQAKHAGETLIEVVRNVHDSRLQGLKNLAHFA